MGMNVSFVNFQYHKMRLHTAMYTIIMLTMSRFYEWQNGVRNRNYFILNELLKREEIKHMYAIDYLPISFRQIFSTGLYRGKNKKKLWGTIKDQVDEKLTVYSLSCTGNVLTLINKIIGQNADTPTIVWSYFPLFVDYFKVPPSDIKVFDAVDDWSEHSSYIKYKKRLRRSYQYIAEHADVIFTVSEYLKEHLFTHHKNVLFVPNGVDAEFFSTVYRQKEKAVIFPQLTSKKKIMTIGYVGTIQSRVDFTLLNYLAQKHTDKQFALVGPLWKEARYTELKNFHNVLFTGRVPYSKLPEVFAKFDVGIIPHTVDSFTKSMDPMKFYEYLACGLPVVSTARLHENPALCYYAPDYDEFSRMINKSIQENNKNFVEQRAAFAAKNSWSNRVDMMMKTIKTFS